jgi:hypothetical protein
MKTKKNRKLKGGTPRILKITGYYDSNDIDKRQLIDFRVEKVNDIEAAEKYWEKHKVSIDPPKGLLEEVLDMFNFNQVYTNKALKRVDAFLSKSDPDKNPIIETRYVMVNDKDDIDKIKITNQLIQRLASMKQQGKIKGTSLISGGGDGDDDENKLSASEKTEINKLKEQLMNEFNEKDKDGISAIVNSPGFARILGEYLNTERSKLRLDQNVLQEIAQDGTAPLPLSNNMDKLDQVLARIEKLATNVEMLNTKINGMGNSVSEIDTKIDTKLQQIIEKAVTDAKANPQNVNEITENLVTEIPVGEDKSKVKQEVIDLLKEDSNIIDKIKKIFSVFKKTDTSKEKDSNSNTTIPNKMTTSLNENGTNTVISKFTKEIKASTDETNKFNEYVSDVTEKVKNRIITVQTGIRIILDAMKKMSLNPGQDSQNNQISKTTRKGTRAKAIGKIFSQENVKAVKDLLSSAASAATSTGTAVKTRLSSAATSAATITGNAISKVADKIKYSPVGNVLFEIKSALSASGNITKETLTSIMLDLQKSQTTQSSFVTAIETIIDKYKLQSYKNGFFYKLRNTVAAMTSQEWLANQKLLNTELIAEYKELKQKKEKDEQDNAEKYRNAETKRITEEHNKRMEKLEADKLQTVININNAKEKEDESFKQKFTNNTQKKIDKENGVQEMGFQEKMANEVNPLLDKFTSYANKNTIDINGQAKIQNNNDIKELKAKYYTGGKKKTNKSKKTQRSKKRNTKRV